MHSKTRTAVTLLALATQSTAITTRLAVFSDGETDGGEVIETVEAVNDVATSAGGGSSGVSTAIAAVDSVNTVVDITDRATGETPAEELKYNKYQGCTIKMEVRNSATLGCYNDSNQRQEGL